MKQNKSQVVSKRRKALIELVASVEDLLTQYSDCGIYEPDLKTSRVERAIMNANVLLKRQSGSK